MSKPKKRWTKRRQDKVFVHRYRLYEVIEEVGGPEWEVMILKGLLGHFTAAVRQAVERERGYRGTY